MDLTMGNIASYKADIHTIQTSDQFRSVVEGSKGVMGKESALVFRSISNN